MASPVCTNCKHYRRGGLFGIRGPLCAHPQSIDKGFTYRDNVTGQVTVHHDRQDSCWSARLSGVCGSIGRLWERK